MAGRFFIGLVQCFGTPSGHADFFRINQTTKRADKTFRVNFASHQTGNHFFPELNFVRRLTTHGGHTGQAGGFSLNWILAFWFCHFVGIGQPHTDLSTRRSTECGNS